MSVADQIVLARQMVSAVLEARRSRRRGSAPIGPDAVRQVVLPSSRVVHGAEELCRAHSPDWLAQHCIRAYYWGSLLALRDGVRYDAELLYVSCLLHDLGLTPLASPPAGECFAITGADAALEHLREAGYPLDRARIAADAIAMHLNVRVTAAEGAEAYLLRAGSGLDVAGARRRELTPALKAEVLARHPRDGFTERIAGVVREQATRSPATRIAFLCGRVGFLDRISRAREL